MARTEPTLGNGSAPDRIPRKFWREFNADCATPRKLRIISLHPTKW
jgi:hypothetical protein